MKRIATSLALLLLVGVAPVRAAECLQQIDNIAVEYDLPASASIAGTKSDLTHPEPPSDRPPAAPPASSFTETPAGRPGMYRGAAPKGGPLSGNVTGATQLPTRYHLSEKQKQQLMAKLQEARAIEALGDERKCMERLKEAQALLGKDGSRRETPK